MSLEGTIWWFVEGNCWTTNSMNSMGCIDKTTNLVWVLKRWCGVWVLRRWFSYDIKRFSEGGFKVLSSHSYGSKLTLLSGALDPLEATLFRDAE